MMDLPSKEQMWEIRARLMAPIPSTESQGYRVMREFSVELLTLLDACAKYIEGTLTGDDETLLMSMRTGRDLVERIGDGNHNSNQSR